GAIRSARSLQPNHARLLLRDHAAQALKRLAPTSNEVRFVQPQSSDVSPRSNVVAVDGAVPEITKIGDGVAAEAINRCEEQVGLVLARIARPNRARPAPETRTEEVRPPEYLAALRSSLPVIYPELVCW